MPAFALKFGPAALLILVCSLLTKDQVVRRSLRTAAGLFFRFFVLVVICLLLLPGCSRRESSLWDMNPEAIKKAKADYDLAIQSGAQGPLYPGQFNRLFPGAQNIISYYSGEIGSPAWTSTAGLYGRYLLKMHHDIKLDEARTKIVSCGIPTFWLFEFTGITFRTNGAPVIQGHQIKTFTVDSWQRLVEANGNFGALGFVLETNKPVENFEAAWRRFP